MATEKTTIEELPTEVIFHLIKSPFYRVIRVSGAMGGVSPQNDVQVTIYNERLPIPTSVTQEVLPDGNLKKEIKVQEGKQGIVREVEATLSIDPRAARSLGVWLLKQAEIALGLVAEDNKEVQQRLKEEL